jgi:hypothetical protein
MPAADARLTNKIYPTPETFQDYSVSELLTAAGYGRIGVDKRLIRAILERGPAAIPEIVRFADEPFQAEGTASLTRSLFLLLRHYRTPEALPFLMALVLANIEELPEELMESVLEIGRPAVETLLAAYDEIDDDDLLGEVAFLLASFRNRDPRILERLLDYFEYDAADGVIILESFGDPAAIPAIEKIMAEPGLDPELHAELASAVEGLREAPSSDQQPETSGFDLLEEFEETEEPVYDILTDYELLAMLGSPSEEYRIGAIDGLIPDDLTDQVLARVRTLAHTDPSPRIRGRAWEALARDPEDKATIAELVVVLEDAAKPSEERVGALIGLASVNNKYGRLNEALLDFYHSFPNERARVIKAMWRTLDKTWAKYVSEALVSSDDDIREQAVLGVGNLSIASEVDKLEALFDHDRLRPAALYAYALAAPGQTSRARMKSMFNLIDKLSGSLDDEETELVEAALDERLAIRGLKPVFHVDEDEHDHEHHHDHDHEHPHPASDPESIPKVGRNDPCPCGSGKKYKKCHGQ